MSNGNDGESTRRRSSESVEGNTRNSSNFSNSSIRDFQGTLMSVINDLSLKARETQERRINNMGIEEAEEQRDEEQNSEEPIRVIRRQVPEEPKEEVEEPIRIIRREIPEEPKAENIPDEDIGEVRQKVIDELFEELYGELKSEVKEELLRAKPEIVRQAAQELKNKLLNELKDQNIKGGKENDR